MAVLHQWMAWEAVLHEVGVDIRKRPSGKGVETEPALEVLYGMHLYARLCLEPLSPRDGSSESFERPAQRDDFAQIAARIGTARPQHTVRIAFEALDGMRADGANIRQTQHVLQTVAIAQRFSKQLARIQKYDR